MKVCIIGDFSENLDEGLKNIAYHIADNLSKNIEIQLINVKNIITLATLRKIKIFHPDIIHYVPGPTNKSIILLKFIKACLKYETKIVLSAPHPMFSDVILKLLNFKPDYIFASSENLKRRMDILGIPTHLLPNGVNIEKFIPVSSNFDKMKIREKYGIEKNSFVVLHVGHIISNRNLGIFTKLVKDNQPVVVASKYIKTDYKLLENLRNAGCIIFQGYFPNIEEFYQLSDCYLFPVRYGKSILCPLSVLEAMSCNLPVITTDFDGIKIFFKEGEGLIFAKKYEEFLDAVEKIKSGEIFVSTRRKIEQYSWQNTTREIIKIYKTLLN
ncbi:MAG TPA: glycosyltransferase family 4 protein [Candidatus Methanofastidiosum sp.]|nr:glycosyltransferase family 4 protein [Methanofastidiosum sp.]